jgi:hypothetical protein
MAFSIKRGRHRDREIPFTEVTPRDEGIEPTYTPEPGAGMDPLDVEGIAREIEEYISGEYMQVWEIQTARVALARCLAGKPARARRLRSEIVEIETDIRQRVQEAILRRRPHLLEDMS